MQRFCEECGNKLGIGAKFCGRCGGSTWKDTTPESPLETSADEAQKPVTAKPEKVATDTVAAPTEEPAKKGIDWAFWGFSALSFVLMKLLGVLSGFTAIIVFQLTHKKFGKPFSLVVSLAAAVLFSVGFQRYFPQFPAPHQGKATSQAPLDWEAGRLTPPPNFENEALTAESKAHYQAIFKIHPDAASIAADPKFKSWVSDSPARQHAEQYGTADEVIDLLTRYKRLR